MLIFLTILHVLISLFRDVVVLLQAGKGGGLASSIGGGLSSSSILGGRSAASFLSRLTTVLAVAFMVSCLVQAVAYQASAPVPTSATERMLEESGMPPAAVPLGEDQGLFQFYRCGKSRKLRLFRYGRQWAFGYRCQSCQTRG